MSGKSVALIVITGMIAMILGCGGAPPVSTDAPAPTEAPEVTGTIVLGDIDSQPTDQIDTWQPLADYLGSHLGESGIGVGAVKVAPDLETMGQWLESGEVDLTFESLYPAMIQITEYGSEPILRQWKGGVAEYSSIIFARTDSEITSLDDLAGHKIACEQSASTTAYFLPIAAVIEAGLKTVELQSTEEPVGKEEVGYIFSGSDASTIQWVISGKADAGGVSSQDFGDIPAETRNQLTIVHETPMVPRQLVLARRGMSAAMKERIAELLSALETTEEGQAIMQKFEKTSRFDALPANTETELAHIQALYEQTLARK